MLRSKNITSNGNGFLLLEVSIPTDGLSRSSNWCFDYQYLCEDYNRRPTGCGRDFRDSRGFADCRRNYNSDMDIRNILGCRPSVAIADLAKAAFSDASINYRAAFGFYDCASPYCSKNLTQSLNALSFYTTDFRIKGTVFYTVCH